VLFALLVTSAACHPGPLVGATRVEAGGTIAGIVSASGGSTALVGRKVTATNLATNAKYEATTATDGDARVQLAHFFLELLAGAIFFSAAFVLFLVYFCFVFLFLF
jgi:hypothetical protein